MDNNKEKGPWVREKERGRRGRLRKRSEMKMKIRIPSRGSRMTWGKVEWRES
jgi:hypothetical protein